MEQNDTTNPGVMLRIDEGLVKEHITEIVRSSVEETLNQYLEQEAERLCNAERYVRSAARRDTRAGFYTRQLETKAGKVNLRIPKLRQTKFETAIIERYKRRESSVEEALIEMYLAGVSTRGIEDITEAFWGSRVSAGTVSNLNEKASQNIEKWRTKVAQGPTHTFIYMGLC